MGSSGHDADAAREGAPAFRPQGFPRAMRLRKRPEFLAVQETGETFHGRHFLAVIAPRQVAGKGDEPARVGITVSKKIGNAVTRNRIKRLVREHVRRNQWLPIEVDTVIIAKRSAAEISCYEEAAQDLSRIRARIGAHARSRRPSC